MCVRDRSFLIREGGQCWDSTGSFCDICFFIRIFLGAPPPLESLINWDEPPPPKKKEKKKERKREREREQRKMTNWVCYFFLMKRLIWYAFFLSCILLPSLQNLKEFFGDHPFKLNIVSFDPPARPWKSYFFSCPPPPQIPPAPATW